MARRVPAGSNPSIEEIELDNILEVSKACIARSMCCSSFDPMEWSPSHMPR